MRKIMWVRYKGWTRSIANLEFMCQKSGTGALFVCSSTNIIKKRFYEEASLLDFELNIGRHAAIRVFLKQLTRHFQSVEAKYQAVEDRRRLLSRQWRTETDHAMPTHQYGMTKVDLPYFSANASSNVTRSRFDVTGHLNTVTNEAIVL